MSISEVIKEVGSTITLNLETLALDNSTQLLKHMPYIYHIMYFKKDQAKVRALLDSDNKVNTMTSAYTAKLGLKI